MGESDHELDGSTLNSEGPSTPYLQPSLGLVGNSARTPVSPTSLSKIYVYLSWRILPVFFLLNILNYLDRTNLAFASINLVQDLNLSSSDYGIGSGLFFIGYSLFQLPSQIILRQVGAPFWLSVIVTIWGITAASMAAITDEKSFFVVRLLLGFAEAGSFPGSWYYLTCFYPDHRITLPFSVTESAIMLAQVVGAPLAAGILQLDGVGGLRGWQWLFLVEGIPTILLGMSLPFLLPPSPSSAPWLQPSDAAAIQSDVDGSRDRPEQPQQSHWQLLAGAVTNRSMYAFGAVKFAKDLTAYGCMFWAPMLIKAMLHKHRENGDACQALDNADGDSPELGHVEVLLTAIPYSLAALASVALAWSSQRTKDRKWHVCICYVGAGLLLLLLPSASEHSIVAGFLALTGIVALSLGPNGCILALASAAGSGPALPLNLAVFNSVGNISGLFGPWIIGIIVERTCSYNNAFYLLGTVLASGGLFVLWVENVVATPKEGLQERSVKDGSYLQLASNQDVHSARRSTSALEGAMDEA